MGRFISILYAGWKKRAAKHPARRPAGGNSLQQQSKFDDFLEKFNNQRPH